MMNGGPVLAIDGTGLLVRCSRAARHRRLFGPGGEPTGALMMFISSLAHKVRTEQPSHVVVAWDGPGATVWRRSKWPGYKPGMVDVRTPGELAQAQEFCDAAGIYQISFPGYEADDILAAVARRYAWSEDLLVICSDDQDMHQLADDAPLTGLGRVVITGLTRDWKLTAAGVRAQWGIRPLWLPMLRALAGDPADGIPGLPGVGNRKALQMLRAGGLRCPPPETVINDPEQRQMVVIWRDIMDLVVPVRPVEYEMGIEPLRRLGPLGRWEPGKGQNALNLLQSYGMVQIAQRLQEGVLW